jgi:hypothetical protein
MLAQQMVTGWEMQPTAYRICVRGRISEQPVAMTVDDLAALIAAESHRHILEKTPMKRHQFQRSSVEYGSGAVRTPRFLHRMRDAGAFARRSGRPSGDAAMDTVVAIEDQLHTLQSISIAQRVSTGITCGAPAVAVAEIHAIDGCDQMGPRPDGDLVETLCPACLATVQRAMAAYVGDKCEMASRCVTHSACTTSGRPTRYLQSIFAVRPIGPEALAS